MEEINQCSHGTELFILQPGTRRAYPEHSQSLGVPDSRRTPRSCRQPCACPAGAERKLQHPGSSIPPAFPFSLSPPSTRSPAGGACSSSPGDTPAGIPATAPACAGQALTARGLVLMALFFKLLHWIAPGPGILLAGISTLTEDVSAGPGGTSQTLGGISLQGRC